MQPTRAHVVPGGPCSMSTTLGVLATAARYAAAPAVPAPTTATSTDRYRAGCMAQSEREARASAIPPPAQWFQRIVDRHPRRAPAAAVTGHGSLL